jgi:GT2 family glycosyltransferase
MYWRHDEKYQSSRLLRRSYTEITYPFDSWNGIDGLMPEGAEAQDAPLMTPMRPDVKRAAGLSIIILTLERFEFINPLLKQVIRARAWFLQHDHVLEIILGDTGSRDPRVLRLYDAVSEEVTIVQNLKYNFSANNNLLASNYSKMDTILFLNNDILFSDPGETLHATYETLRMEAEWGILGSFLFYPNGLVQHAGIQIVSEGKSRSVCEHICGGRNIIRPDRRLTLVAPAVTGAFLAIRADLFEFVGRFDERYRRECQDVDLCLAAWRAGKRVGLVYRGDVVHVEGGTRSRDDACVEDRRLFSKKWSSFLEVEDYR